MLWRLCFIVPIVRTKYISKDRLHNSLQHLTEFYLPGCKNAHSEKQNPMSEPADIG